MEDESVLSSRRRLNSARKRSRQQMSDQETKDDGNQLEEGIFIYINQTYYTYYICKYRLVYV